MVEAIIQMKPERAIAWSSVYAKDAIGFYRLTSDGEKFRPVDIVEGKIVCLTPGMIYRRLHHEWSGTPQAPVVTPSPLRIKGVDYSRVSQRLRGGRIGASMSARRTAY